MQSAVNLRTVFIFYFMKKEQLLDETTVLILRDLEFESTTPIIDEAQLLEEVAHVVAYMIEHKIDLLLSTMYRMDVDEVKIHAALNAETDTQPVNYRLAKLIIDRQKKRVLTKHNSKVSNRDDFNDSIWGWNNYDTVSF